MNSHDYSAHLQIAIQVAKKVGALLLADMHRDDGPRGSNGKAPADEEAESLIRDTLETAFPSHGIIGEELSARDRKPQGQETHTWWIDPNDGTSGFLRGLRGASVSIGLARDGVPVLGVVLAYAAPDDTGDLITWAEGQSLTRNGERIDRAPWPSDLDSNVVAAISQDADKKSSVNAKLVSPARFITPTGIAYRLALVAVGDADAAVSLGGAVRWDCAAGHALVIAAGGELYNGAGEVVRYNNPWTSKIVIGGAPDLCTILLDRSWGDVFEAPQESETGAFKNLDLSRPKPGSHYKNSGVLSRAQGALLGQFAGDALGQLVEFKTARDIAATYPKGVRTLHDGGTFNTVAGQPTDDSEMALALARTLAHHGKYDADSVATAYANWLDSGPFDSGMTTQTAILPAIRASQDGTSPALAARTAASLDSQANGALMRISPLAVFGYVLPPKELALLARRDAALTHPHMVCQDANAIFTVAIAFAIRAGATQADIYEFALDQAKVLDVHKDVHASLIAAQQGPPDEFQHQMGWVRIAFQNAFFQLLHAPNVEEGIVDTVGRGGDTDTNAAIAGALLGAAYGREAIPRAWRKRLATCRPITGLDGVSHPRPRTFWPVDALQLAENLLNAGP